jgi:hypothetical protein
VVDPSGPEWLSARRQVVVVLWLVVDARGDVLYGEIVEPHAERPGRFIGTAGLTSAIDGLLRSSAAERGPDAAEHDRVD